MLTEVIGVSVPRAFLLRVTFSSGDIRLFDMEPLLGLEIYKHLRDSRRFRRASVDLGTVTWPDGEDIAPETLLDHGVGVGGKESMATARALELMAAINDSRTRHGLDAVPPWNQYSVGKSTVRAARQRVRCLKRPGPPRA
ncbi:MAG: DUF2442 domain-containing protein [Desulfobacterales bacterium]|nr:DUF2442 domain-containing protein [Desulfobacterales bacterium]